MNLEVDDNGKDHDGGKEVHQVGQVLTIERLAQTTHFILTSCQQVKQGNHSAFKLRTWTQHTTITPAL